MKAPSAEGACAVMSLGSASMGAVVSPTVMLKSSVIDAPFDPNAVHFTGVTPIGRSVPAAGSQRKSAAGPFAVVAVTSYFTVAPSRPSASANTDAGPRSAGVSSLPTGTRKSCEPVLPKRSLLVQVIDDVPMRKNDPDSGLQSGLTSASTRSVALTSNVTIDPSALPNQSKSVGVLIAGGVLSATRTANESFAEFPRSSEATQSTVVVVNGKNSPDLCEQS